MASVFTIEDCLKTCTEFCKVIKKCFGPRGELSFIVSCTGQGQFTTSGMTIIQKAQPLHPIAKIILQTVQKHHECIGDGSKAFLLLLNEIFVQIHKQKTDLTFTNNAKIKLIHGFTFLLHYVLPECFMEIRGGFSDLKKEQMLEQEKNNFSPVILCLLKVFFSGKFSFSVSDALSTLVHHFLVENSQTWKSAFLAIKCIVDNFGVMCSAGGTTSLDGSQVLPGVVLSREFAVCPISKTVKHNEKFVVISAESNPLNETSDVSFSIEGRETISKLIENQFYMLKVLTEQKRKENISLIITTGKAPDSIKALCRDCGIQLITMVPREEVNYIIELTQVHPVKSFTEEISEENCGALEFVKTVQIQNKDLAYIGLKCRKTNCFPYHLILSGPSEAVCKQYLKEMWNSLKLIYRWKTDSDRHNQNCSRDGMVNDYKSSSSFHRTVKQISENDNEKPISSRELHFANDINTDSENSFHLNPSTSNSSLYFTVCPAGGCWELYLHYILARKDIDNPDLQIACRILSQSLIIIPYTLYMNNSYKVDCFPLVWKTATEKLQSKGELSYVNKWGEVNRLNDCEEYEPVIAKEVLISEVVQLVIQLLHLQSVVSVDRNFVTT